MSDNQVIPEAAVNYADMKAMLAEAGFSLEILSPAGYAIAIQQANANIEMPGGEGRSAGEGAPSEHHQADDNLV